MQLIFALLLLWGGFLCGTIYSKSYKQIAEETQEELLKPKTSFRSPLVRYEKAL